MDMQDKSMHTQKLVAFFPSIEDAANTRTRLIDAGFTADAIRLTGGAGSPAAENENQSFFEWLFGSDMPDHEREWYGSNLRDGRTALSIQVESPEDIHDIEELFAAGGALEVEQSDGASLAATTPMSAADEQRPAPEDEDTVIPVVNEELKVGKRATETRRLVRTRVIERPVQERVQLQDETVVVERRPASGNTAAARDGLQEREFEVIERHEEPIVEKRARAVEEVVVKKDVKRRAETVSDKVRETQVEVDGERLGANKT
jgi:stress response protein YsnF